MTVERADSIMASYIEALGSEKESNGAEILKGGTMPSLMRIDEHKMMPKKPSTVLNHCMQQFKDSLATDAVNEMAVEKIESTFVHEFLIPFL